MTLLATAFHPTETPPPASWRAKTWVAAVLTLLVVSTSPLAFEAGRLAPAGLGGLARVVAVMVALMLGLGAAALVVWAVDRPWPAALVTAGLAPVGVLLADGGGTASTVTLVLGVALACGWRRPAVAAALAGVLVATSWWVQVTSGLGVDALLFTVFGVAAVLGLVLRSRVGTAIEMDRQQLTRRAGEVEQQAGVVAERARLAHDLHDVVAHHVSLIAVRAETAPYVHPDLQPQARAVLAEVATDARLALDELRGVLGILSRSEGSGRAPQPTWADIPALVERSRDTGMDLAMRGDVDARVPAGVGYAAYRVVQESLTNARKHAPGEPVDLELSAGSALVAVTVRSRLGAEAPPITRGSGRGLPGMRERVEGLGGRLTAGPREGEFVVEAVFGSRA